MAGDGMNPYQTGGAGGKFQKRTVRRTTPYDRPITAIRNNNSNSNPSLLSKLTNPASRLLYAGADKLFGVFRKRLPSIPPQILPDTIEEPRNGLHEAGPSSGSKDATVISKPSSDGERNLASVSAATEISEIENVFKQKTFTRSEIERLKALLESKTPESDVCEGDKEKLISTTYHVSTLDASTSGTLNKHVEEKENFHAAISTPIVNSRAFDEDVASPAELAKAYMGTRPAKVLPWFSNQPPRLDSAVLNNTTTLSRTPITSPPPRTVDTFKGYENRFTTPRSQGRTSLYNMSNPPYYRGTSAFSQKDSKSDYNHGASSPLLAWKHEGTIGSSKMAGKRRNSELDDIRSGGPIRRIRQKSNLLTQVSKQRSEIGVGAQRLLLRNEPDPKGSKAVKENGEKIYNNLGHSSVPSKSTEMALKIFEQLERMSPKEKPSVSRFAGTTEKLATKGTSSMSDKVESPKLLPNFQPDAGASTSRSNNKVEENGQKMFAVPRNELSSMNGNSKVPSEPPQKKRAFQMSAYEESVELDEDNLSNGHVSVSRGENKKPESSVFANKNVSNDPPAKVIQNCVPPEVTSSPKTDFGSSSGSVVNKQKTGFNFPTSSQSSSYTQSPVLSQLNSVVDTALLNKETTVLPKFSARPKSAEKVSPFMFSANETSGVEQNISPDAKLFDSTSSFTENNQVQLSVSNNDNNDYIHTSVNMFATAEPVSSASPTNPSASGNIHTSVNMFATSEPVSSASPTNPSASGIFSFGDSIKNSRITNGTSAVVAAPETAASKSNNVGSLPFASKSFSSEAATSTTSISSQGSLFNGTNFQVKTQTSTTVTQAPLFKFSSGSSGSSPFDSSAPSFGLGSAVATSEFKSGSSTSNLFASGFASTPSFGPSSTSGSTTNIFGSAAWQPSQSAAASNTSFPTSSPGQSVFGNSTPVFGAPNNNNDLMSMEDSMAEDKTPSPSVPAVAQASAGPPGFVFGSTTPTPSATTPFQFGSQTSQPSSQNPSTPFQFGSQTSQPASQNPSAPFQFGSQTSQQSQNPSTPFQFGSQTSQSTSQNPSTPFQFASQTSQTPSQNPFQASGGSFSLGSGGGGDKSGRRFIKAKRRK